MATTIQLRRDTATNWTSLNHTLAAGEAGYETDTGKLKIGNGTTAWNSLAYFIGSAGPAGPSGPPLPTVNAVATANVVTLSGTTTIDGVALTAGQVVFLVTQTTASQNGPWVIAAGAWTRPTWFASGSTYLGVALVALPGGTQWGSTEWFLTNTTTVTVDTTATTWAPLPPAVIQGTHANRPTAAAWNRNLIYFETDTGLEYQNWSGSAWTQITSGTELAYADLTANLTGLTSTAIADLTGLSLSFVAPSRPFYLHGFVYFTQTVTGGEGFFYLADSANTQIAFSGMPEASTGLQTSGNIWARLPQSGGYAITPGNSYTFKLRYAVNSGTLAVGGGSNARSFIRAVAA